ncbi:hypothetical protein, partial [Natronococcus sp.]|uniref:hypothetical protein n=1 Tax=Natronococcus sp. TaxID=35747 RepID=UPI003A4E574B
MTITAIHSDTCDVRSRSGYDPSTAESSDRSPDRPPIVRSRSGVGSVRRHSSVGLDERLEVGRSLEQPVLAVVVREDAL